MAQTLSILASLLLVLLFAGGVIWGLFRWWKGSDDRSALAFRWGLTFLTGLFIMFVAVPLVLQGGFAGAFGGIPMAAFGGLVLAIIWTRPLTESVGKKFGQLYDGGKTEADPEPCFSIVEANRKRGRYPEAVAEARKQLEKFPTHARAHLLLAEILADDLHDLDGARAAVERFINQEGHAPKNVAYALNRLADWHLKHARDDVAARECFERILALLPDTTEAHFAHQRLAHLATTEGIAGGVSRAPLVVPKADPHLGVRTEYRAWKPKPEDPLARAGELVAQLERFPQDNRAREELAVLYASALDRIDLATDQLGQLIAQPHAPPKQIVHWLNLLAELQIKSGAELAVAQATLGQIRERFPGSAGAETAQRRLATLKLETRAKKESQVFALGSPKRADPAEPP